MAMAAIVVFLFAQMSKLDHVAQSGACPLDMQALLSSTFTQEFNYYLTTGSQWDKYTNAFCRILDFDVDCAMCKTNGLAKCKTMCSAKNARKPSS